MRLEELLKKINPKLKGIVYNLSRSSVFLQQEDLYQEALFHLWKDFTSGKLKDKTESYVLQGCYFYLKNYIRCHRPKANLISWDSFYPAQSDSEPDRMALLAEHEAVDYREKLDSSLLAETICNNGLTEKEKEILSYYARGLTVREIGLRLGGSHVWVVKLTKCIREKCRKYLDNF